MADKYNIRDKLEKFSKEYNANHVYLQGETVGAKVQGNPYNMGVRNFYAFNLVVDGIRYDNEGLFAWCDKYEIPHVPLIFEHHQIPDNIDNMKAEAHGKSLLNHAVLREGLVYRDETDSFLSFKNVDIDYLMKQQ